METNKIPPIKNTPQNIITEEDCEYCDNGMRTYPSIYIDGDLYQDSEIGECDECGGSGKVPKEEVA